MDKLVYNSNYEILDEHMSPSNIGARKGRNVRDHLFVINAVLQEIEKDKNEADVSIYDVKAAFDKLWKNETSNDVFDNGLNGDHFIISSIANNICNVSIKMPWGKNSKTFALENVEQQGSVSSPLRCSITTDSLGKDILSSHQLSQAL